MRASRGFMALVGLAWAATGASAQDIPIMSGRYSSESCLKADHNTTRYFRAGFTTTTPGEACTIKVGLSDGKVFHTRILCRYKQGSPSDDEVVLRVDSPSRVTWINQCTETTYHLCSP